MNPTADSLNIITLITDASLVVQIVMAILLLASLFGWLTIFRLSARFGRANRADNYFEEVFWSGVDLRTLYQGAKTNQHRAALEAIFFTGFSEFLKLGKKELPKTELVMGTERKLRVGLHRQQQQLEQGLSALASIGSVSPYIGLFGTVWGIMNAFLGLSQATQASIATVAPGIAEALIATAMGLFAAIPAVLAYNHYTSTSEAVYTRRALFCDELTGLLQREVNLS